MSGAGMSKLQGYLEILSAPVDDQRALFQEGALRHGVDVRNVEKDFWVHLVLGLLFAVRRDGVGMNFKGGTSLSLGFGLIDRFSEDIDITVDRAALPGAPSDEAMRQAREMSSKRHTKTAEEISTSCGAYVSGPLRDFLAACAKAIVSASDLAGIDVAVDPAEKFGQNLLFSYPTLFASASMTTPWNSEAIVRIEAGARGAMEPLKAIATMPMVADRMANPGLLKVPGIPAISPVRTFCDKLTAVHAFKRTHGDENGKAPADRMSRHYYDLHVLWRNDALRIEFLDNLHVLEETKQHKLLLFYRKNERLEEFDPAALDVLPTGRFREMLAKDYTAMSGMIRGEAPAFDDVMTSLSDIEAVLRLRCPRPDAGDPPGWPDDFADLEGLAFEGGASRPFARWWSERIAARTDLTPKAFVEALADGLPGVVSARFSRMEPASDIFEVVIECHVPGEENHSIRVLHARKRFMISENRRASTATALETDLDASFQGRGMAPGVMLNLIDLAGKLEMDAVEAAPCPQDEAELAKMGFAKSSGSPSWTLDMSDEAAMDMYAAFRTAHATGYPKPW